MNYKGASPTLSVIMVVILLVGFVAWTVFSNLYSRLGGEVFWLMLITFVIGFALGKVWDHQ
jgi:hypothetical protein